MKPIEHFSPEGISRVLCIVAHPDDMEYGGSAAIAEWSSAGIEVTYLLLTAGEAGIRDRNPEEVMLIRAEEQREACTIVGVHHLEILNHPDGELTHTLELRKNIARKIREYRPHAVVTMTWELESAWGLNHADHRATGTATIDAIRDADNPWVFSDLLDSEGLAPWKTEQLIVLGHRPSHAILISPEACELGIRSLEAHREYLAALPDHPVPREMIPTMLARGGEAAGTDLALLVRVFDT